MQPPVLILGEFSFSFGEAGSNYVLGLGYALREAGVRVEYLAQYAAQGPIREDFKDFTCHSIPDEPDGHGWKHAWSRITASNNKLLDWLAGAATNRFGAVIVYPEAACSVGFVSRLRRLCRSKCWPIAIVVVEWHGFRCTPIKEMHHKILAFANWEILARSISKQIHNVIVVSSFLDRYYKAARCNVVRIPPLIDTTAGKWGSTDRKNGDIPGVRLLFSGSSARDRLDLVIDAVSGLRRQGHDITLEFLGTAVGDLVSSGRLKRIVDRAPAGALLFHGRVPADRVLAIARSADFGIMLRDRVRWSNACFPSKVAEFQALGIPMLCNLTTDLGDFLTDGENALVVEDVSANAFAAAAKRALVLSGEKREAMRQASLKCAATMFDHRAYASRIGEFVSNVTNAASGQQSCR